jgi:hypothetical protein
VIDVIEPNLLIAIVSCDCERAERAHPQGIHSDANHVFSIQISPLVPETS